MLYRSLTITSFLLATGLLWHPSAGFADPAIGQSAQPASPESQPVNPLLLGNPTLDNPPANVVVPIVPADTNGQSDRAPGQTVVPSSPSVNSPASVPAAQPAPVAPAIDFPHPSDLPSPPTQPTPPITADSPPGSSAPAQPPSAPVSPVPATSGPSTPNLPTIHSPTPLGTPTLPATSSPAATGAPTAPPTSSPAATGTSVEPPANSNPLLPKPPGLQDQPGNIINFTTEPSPPPLMAEPLRLEIKLSKRQVVLYQGDAVVKSYPIAVGRPGWETPKGKFQVRQMFKNPVWVSPLEKGVTIPGGDPENPLGRFWIGFWTDGKNWIGFHGTPNPKSVGRAASHGCIRMYNKDIEDLFQRVSLGIEVRVVD